MKKSSKVLPVVICTAVIVAIVAIIGLSTVKFDAGHGDDVNSDGSYVDVDYDSAILIYNSSKLIEADENNGQIADHVRGKADSKVIVVEYADLQCPGCAAMMPSMHKLYEKYADKVAFVFRNFPIESHKNARTSAAAAESAGFQGYYWEMMESLYANRADWLSKEGSELTEAFVDIFKGIAPEGNVEKFRTEMKRGAIQNKLDFDYNLGRQVDGVTYTPAIFVNGKMIDASAAEKISDYINLVEEEIIQALK